MRMILAAALCALGAQAVSAQVYVAPTVRSNGTYVQPHYRTAPNNTLLDNYSTRPNVNPYTGRTGTVDPYRTPTYKAPSWQSSYKPRKY